MQQTENPSRERILARIRAGLHTPPSESGGTSSGRVIFEPIQNPLQRFQQECAANLTECVLTTDTTASADDPSLRWLIDVVPSSRPIRWSSQGAPSEASPATVTLAEALIAQTGSVFVTASCGGRGASVVAPCHIVFATVAQLVPDLQTALSSAFKEDKLAHNSFACVISGSSRTADIEKILVQGAHGPRRLVIILQTGT
ncbi:MAG: hypothetical protein AUH86_24010 [Acidobacteria bacterium 13_1_40CM_4_58_4]|nr:MAG: hypothetical protein AUH86_24010 [Acidobacteria bacterium 13_1_40CM_4_58_4]